MRSSVAWTAPLVGAILLGAPVALAAGNGGIALDQLDPTPAGDAFFGVPSPFARGNVTPRATVVFDYANQPLELHEGAGTTARSASLVEKQAFLHVNASFAIQDRLLISALLPIALIQAGDSPRVGSVRLTSPTSAQVGDLRLGARVRMVGDDDDPVQLGVGFNVFVPTGPGATTTPDGATHGAFTGEGMVRVAPQLLLGGHFKLGVPFVWTTMGGVMVRPTVNPSMITYGAGLAVSLFQDRIQFGPEFYASTPIQSGGLKLTDKVTVTADQSTNAELLVGARVRIISGLMAGWAAGPGLTKAIGTPEFRFVGTLGWAPGLPRPAVTEATADTDGDGIPDTQDACPYAFGPRSADAKKNGCPVVDDDEDGIPNDEDACPDRYGPRTRDPKTNGCPAAPAQ